MGLGGRGVGSYRDLEDKGVLEEAAVKNHRVYSRETYVQNLYRIRENGGFQ